MRERAGTHIKIIPVPIRDEYSFYPCCHPHSRRKFPPPHYGHRHVLFLLRESPVGRYLYFTPALGSPFARALPFLSTKRNSLCARLCGVLFCFNGLIKLYTNIQKYIKNCKICEYLCRHFSTQKRACQGADALFLKIFLKILL